MPITDFSHLDLHADLQSNLAALGYQTPTPIQAQSLPSILAGKDVIAQAKTGSGKTAAFGLGILNQLQIANRTPQALVLCPTRELADQVAGELQRLARRLANVKVLTLCGGAPIGAQLNSLQKGAHVIVGTPGRIQDHFRKKTLTVESLKVLVLDEADRMLEMGFQPALADIMASLPTPRQTLLFSATFPEQIERLSEQFMHQPQRIEVAERHNEATIKQLFFSTNKHEKPTVLKTLLYHFRPSSSVIFCNTKAQVQTVIQTLKADGFSALALHGDLEQKERDQTLIQFANKSIAILVATDVAARGLDIDALDAVINYDMPQDVDIHTHRIGRTGRAGSQGLAISMVDPNGYKDQTQLKLLEALQNSPIILSSPSTLNAANTQPLRAPNQTLQIDGGKKQKLRPGDIVGALTSVEGLQAEDVGNIKITAIKAYVAIRRPVAKKALKIISDHKLKNRNFRARLLT